MRILLNKRLHVNMGAYEHLEAVATVEVNTETDAAILAKIGYNVTEIADVEAFINLETDRMLEGTVEDAHFLTDVSESFIHQYHSDHTTRNDTKKK